MPESLPTTVMIPGTPATTVVPPTTNLFQQDLRVISAYDIQPPARDGGPVKLEELNAAKLKGQVVELEFADGRKLWVAGDRLYAKLVAEKRTAKTRGLTTEPEEQVRLPHAFALPGATRGLLGQAVLKGLRLIGIDPASQLAKGIAREAVRRIEDQLVKGTLDKTAEQLSGADKDCSGWLFPFDDKVQVEVAGQIKTPNTLSTAEPYLLFLHGTASSSNGSFGKLAGTEEWKQLRADYGARILAFEHRSLSASPIKNALDLLRLLPDSARVHLVSHSRGGLVGELLCLGQVARAQTQLEDLLAVYEKARGDSRDAQQAREEERALLGQLWEEADRKNLRVERFVRVACPARGTTWLADNLDYFFSALLHAVELVPGLTANPIYDFIKATMTTLVELRANPAELPGLEAMMPAAPLIGFLNQPGLVSSADLAVIAGDSEVGGSLSGSLLTLLTNTVLWEKNDWVVNTRAMDGGLKREKNIWYFFDQGADVNHFSYFVNPDTRRRLAARLALRAQPFEQTKGFTELKPRAAARINVTAARGGPSGVDARGTVFVLPGIMGSELQYQSKDVWLNYLALMRGGMSQLDAKHAAPDVQPDGLMSSDYKRLVEELGRNYRVIPFAYDWRNSVKDAGERLAGAVRETLGHDNQPVHLLAHSMGGLVARSLIAHDGELWRELGRRQGRLVMLGTPNNGAAAIARMLLGEEKLLKMLALLDFKHDLPELLQLIRAYPGVLDLLPKEYFDEQPWRELKAEVPDKAKLKAAQEWRARLNKDAAGSPQMIYVAGAAERTPTGLRRLPDGGLEVTETTQGDGRVTYELGQLEAVPTYYADVIHGDMADHPPLFPALFDLLEQGKTDRLARQPFKQRGVDALTVVTRAETLAPVYPTEEDLLDALNGERRRSSTASGGVAAETAYTLQVSVMHGQLRYAEHPVAVGHYNGDSIVSAEYILDKRLDGRLSERHGMELYPGPVGTAEVVIVGPEHQPPGALVIGLGEVGEIRADVVRHGVTAAALRYAIGEAERPARPHEKPGWRSAGLSPLLIGTYGGRALTVPEAVEAILTGVVQANRILQAQGLWERVRLDRVELVELYEDVAIQAIHAAHRLRQQPPAEFGDQVGIEVAPSLLKPERGGRYQRPAAPVTNDWWRRIQIVNANPAATATPKAAATGFPDLLRHLSADPELRATQRQLLEKLVEEAVRVPAQRQYLAELISHLLGLEQAAQPADDDVLEFTVLTDRARAEGLRQATQRFWVDQLIRGSIADARYNPSLAATLFELLVPNELKNQPENVLLVLDRAAAQYPWELLVERSQPEQPVVTQIGLLRQFKALDFRPNPQRARARQALVVGDTANHGLPELFGAQDEGRRIATALNAAQFKVTDLIKKDGLQVVTELFAREYQILHIAAHGIFDLGESRRQGIVLGPGQYLTTTELVNLRAVPDLVFINCCHLGKLDTQTQSDQGRLNTEYPHRLAASIAEELIKIGVKAVVAAGWAVDDDAALTFAEEFYRAMLDGTRFGDAVLAARRKTFQQHRQTNTWGAYQCYGNPAFTLDTWRGRGGRSETHFYSRREYRDEVKGIAEQPDAADPAQNRQWIERMQSLDKLTPAELRDGEVLAGFGDAWRELGEFDKAIEVYEAALKQADARASLQVVERLANLQSRTLDRAWRQAEAAGQRLTAEQKQTATQRLNAAADRLRWLNQLEQTEERLSLLGRVYKSLALLADTPAESQQSRALLEQARDCYQQASTDTNAPAHDNYPLFNWLACRLLLEDAPAAVPARKASKARKAPPAAPRAPTDEINTRLDEGVAAAQQRLTVKEDFWARVAWPDALVLRHLRTGTLPAQKERIIAAYQTAFATGARPSEVDTVLAQLDFLRVMLARHADAPPSVEALREIEAALAS